MYFRLFVAALIALTLIGTSTSGLLFAHSGATGIVKERMDLMKGIGDAMKKLTAIFKGEVVYDAKAVREAARSIHDRAGDHVTALFPEGSLDKPTETLPTVWEDWATFERYATELETFAAVLEAAAGNEFGPMHDQGMGREPTMGNPGNGPMMSSQEWGADHRMNDPEALKEMPPMASFMRLSETCNACHTRFRIKK